MAKAAKYYIVSAQALPDIFIQVAEAKRMLQSGEVRTAGDAAKAVGIRENSMTTVSSAASRRLWL